MPHYEMFVSGRESCHILRCLEVGENHATLLNVCKWERIIFHMKCL